MIDTSGNVGIGTTSPSRVLHTQGASVLFGNTSGAHEILFGDSAHRYFKLYTPSSPDYASIRTGTTNILVAHSDGTVGIGETAPLGKLHVKNADSGVTSPDAGFDDFIVENSADVGISLLSTDTATIAFNDANGAPDGSIQYRHDDRSTRFTNSGSERMRINSSGQLLLNTTSNNSDSYKMIADLGGGAKGIDVRNVSYNADNGAFRSVPSGNTSYRFAVMLNSSNSTVGKIEVTSSNTTYTTSSDYRLKENVGYTFDATTRLKQLNPLRFNFIEDADTTVDGFLAHEAAIICPESVTGTKDEVDADGNPIMQGIDQSKIVPLLVKTLQEAITKIETLETKVQALEDA